MTAVWPVAVNAYALRDSYTEEPERNVLSFKPEVGPPKERRRSSVSTDMVSFTGKYTLVEWTALKTFYRDTLLDGVLPFTFTNPLTGVSATYKFTAAPKLRTTRQLKVQAALQMRRQP